MKGNTEMIKKTEISDSLKEMLLCMLATAITLVLVVAFITSLMFILGNQKIPPQNTCPPIIKQAVSE